MRPHCRVFDVVSLPAKNRSRQQRTRLPSSKPNWLFLFFCRAKQRDKHTAKRLVSGFHTVYIDWLFVRTILPLGRCQYNLVGYWGPDPTCASLSLSWSRPPKSWRCWRCHCEAPAGVSSVLGTHHKAVRRKNRAFIQQCEDLPSARSVHLLAF